jgi:hypothetical protein
MVLFAPFGRAEWQDARFPALEEALQITRAPDFCGEPVPIERRSVRESLEKELLITLWNRFQVILWLKRAHRYFPIIESMLQKAGLPDDLKYVAVIESSLLPHVGSPKGAVGFWQFIKSTGRKYGLTINEDRDERRNIYDSTRAAVRYFRKLYADFGSWTLAAAAYNMGELGLQSNIEYQKINDYYRLYLPLETQRFLFKIVSAKMILSNPEKYGFLLSPDSLWPPIATDLVDCRSPERFPLQLVAEAARTDYKTMKELNPEIRGRYLTKGFHRLRVPQGAGAGFAPRLADHIKTFVNEQAGIAQKKSGKRRIHVVKRGETLSEIAERYGVSISMLMRWNRLKKKNYIFPGQHLAVYPKSH